MPQSFRYIPPVNVAVRDGASPLKPRRPLLVDKLSGGVITEWGGAPPLTGLLSVRVSGGMVLIPGPAALVSINILNVGTGIFGAFDCETTADATHERAVWLLPNGNARLGLVAFGQPTKPARGVLFLANLILLAANDGEMLVSYRAG